MRGAMINGNVAMMMLAAATVAASHRSNTTTGGATVEAKPATKAEERRGVCACGVVPAKGSRCRKCRKDGS